MERSILYLTSGEEAVYLDVSCQLLFLVNLILRSPAFIEHQISGGTFFSCEIFTQVLKSCNQQQCQWLRVLGRVLFMNLTFVKASE